MRQMFPSKAVNASNILVTNWTNDEYAYGSWSAMPEKFSKSDWSEVRKNEKRLYFAGEHTSSNYGFVHSAYQSGVQTANEVLNDINNVSKPTTTERKYCFGNINLLSVAKIRGINLGYDLIICYTQLIHVSLITQRQLAHLNHQRLILHLQRQHFRLQRQLLLITQVSICCPLTSNRS